MDSTVDNTANRDADERFKELVSYIPQQTSMDLHGGDISNPTIDDMSAEPDNDINRDAINAFKELASYL